MSIRDLETPGSRSRFGAVAVLLLSAAAPRAAAASAIQCGDVLGAGSWLLEADLVCPSNSGFGVGLTLGSGAHLDLGGHSVGMTIAGSGTAIVIAGDGATLRNGTVTSADVGIFVDGGKGNHLRDLRLTLSNVGIRLAGANGNHITDSVVDGMAVYGILLESSHRNRLDRLEVNDTSGIGPAAGIALLDSDGNHVTRSEVLRSQCTGIFVRNSSRNMICFNSVRDTFVFLNGPSVDILLRDGSSRNLVCSNQVSAATSPAVTSDGINVGCKGSCHCGLGGPGFSTPSTGATRNLVLDNTADGELRYGIAQAPGNPDNAYVRNVATDNGVADFAIDP